MFPGEEWEDRNWSGYKTTALEDRAEAMSLAVEGLCRGRYPLEGWRTLIDGLLRLEDINLKRVQLAASTSYSYSYPVKNLWTPLKRNLTRLKDEAIQQALDESTPTEALRQTLSILTAYGP